MRAGPKMTQKTYGFSRILWDAFACNKHAGICNTEVGKKKVYHDNNGKFVKKLRKKTFGNGLFNRKSNRKSIHENFNAVRKENQTVHTVKILKRPKEYNMKNK